MYLKKSFKTNCICNHLYQVNAYHVVCLSLYPVCLPRQPGWQWPGAPQRVGAHGGGIWEEDAGSAASTRSPPPSISLSVSPAEGDGEEPQAGGTIPLHTSRQTLHRVAQLYAAALQGGVNASHKTAASSAHSGSSWTAKTTQPGEGRVTRKGSSTDHPSSHATTTEVVLASSRTGRGPCTRRPPNPLRQPALLSPADSRQPTAKQAPGPTTSPGSINQSINCANFVCFQTCNF